MDKNLMDYFVERTDERFDKLESKIDRLLEFKWQIIGGATALSAFVGIAIQLFFKLKG